MKLVLMTDSMYHSYFMEYENDEALYIDKSDYKEYIYNKFWVDKYIKKQRELNRVCLGILDNSEIIGEVIFKDLTSNSATLSISMRNRKYKNIGLGTIAVGIAIEYALSDLKVRTIYADALKTNLRSVHVLYKCGFKYISSDDNFNYYKFEC